MTGPDFIDEIDCGSFFDHIDDLLDFPNDDVETGFTTNVDAINNNSNSTNNFSSTIWPIQSESLPGSDSVFSGANNSSSGLSAELTVPYEDIVQLEWLSNFVEDSFSGGSLTINNLRGSSTITLAPHQFQTSSPVSVLESSSSCSGEKNISSYPENIIPGRCGRARSKRPRPRTFSPRPTTHLISSTSSISESASKFWSDSENFAESRPLIKIPEQVFSEQKKKKKVKMSVPLAQLEMNENHPPSSQSVRKCMHCEITKTPQWRAGPMGPKTLCNACGVRYKSGRLFPEYRPAASPTFVPSIHSNSHKKVIEMRNRIGEVGGLGETEPEFIPNMKNNISLEFI